MSRAYAVLCTIQRPMRFMQIAHRGPQEPPLLRPSRPRVRAIPGSRPMPLAWTLPLPLPTMGALCALVFLAGFVDAIAGGGGLISLPAFLACGIPTHVAFGCNKCSSAIGTTFSTARYFRHGAMDVGVALMAALAAFIGSGLATNMALLVPEDTFRVMVVCVLPVAALVILTRKADALAQDHSDELPRTRKVALAALIGFLIGAYDGLVGPGTGTFAIIAFNLLMRYDLKRAGGNAKVMNLASNYASLVVLLFAGKVDFAIALPAAAFCVAGHTLGSGLALKRGARFIQPMLVCVLVLLLANLITQLVG